MLFVHVSDIHFDERHVGQPDDPDLALRDEMLRDVKHMRQKLGKADGLLLGGDTAFAGTEKEFEFAFEWIRDKLCPAAGCDLSQVFSVPGNHDVSRKADRPVYELARAGLLKLQADELDDTIRRIVRDKPSSKLFFDPLENYNKFAARFLCSIGPFDEGTEPGTVVLPHARRDLKMEDGSTLRLWGFNSVLVSDRKDAERRMLVDPSAGQIEQDEGVIHLVMCHHPFGWLRNGEEFQSRIERVSKLHLFGHEHTLRFEDARKFARIRAGALQPERKGPKWKPGYNWIDIGVEGRDDDRRLRLKVWTRQYDSDRFLGLGDDEGNEHWDRTYPLDRWSAPAAAPAERAEIPVLLTPPVDEAVVHVPAPGVSLRDLTLHAYEIRVDQQRALLVKLGLEQESELLPDHRVGTALVARALAADCTERLRAELEALAPSKGETTS